MQLSEAKPLSPDETRTDGLIILRALACCGVLVAHTWYHASISAPEWGLAGNVPLDPAGFGVACFFVLSGFLMGVLVSRKPTASKFMMMRLVRIYPGYWLAGLLFAALGSLHLQPEKWRFDICGLLLLPSGMSTNYGVPAWTLIYEMFFYCLVFVLLTLRCRGTIFNWVFGLWAALIILVDYVNGQTYSHAMPRELIPISCMNLLFISGFVFGLNRFAFVGKVPGWSLAAIAAAAWLVARQIEPNPHRLPVVLVWCLSCTATVLYFSQISTVSSSMAKALGDASYGIYLVHYMLIDAFTPYVKSALQSPISIFVGLTIGALGLSWGFGLIENELHKRLKKWVSKRMNRGGIPRGDRSRGLGQVPIETVSVGSTVGHG